MGFPFFKRSVEQRETIQSSDPRMVEFFGMGGSTGITNEQALQVPAVWGAINFIAGTMAGLPLHVFDKKPKGERKRVSKGVGDVLGKIVNEEESSFQWRYQMFSTGVLTSGRFVTYIERDKKGEAVNLFPIIGATCERMENGKKRYVQNLKDGKKKYYKASDVIDIPFMLKDDLITARSPLRSCSTAISKAYHANEYGAKLFSNGGLPAFTLEGPFGDGKSAARGAKDIETATKEAAKRGGNVLAIPLGHSLKELGQSPEALQMIETQGFGVLEVARIFLLPPTFLQDLSNGTFSNTEQQDLQLVKHTIKRWCEQVEAELNLKLFGREATRYAEFNLDGLMRGDFMSTMQGNAVGIQSGQITPEETRDKRNLSKKPGADQLFIQGATVPINQTGTDKGADNVKE